MSVTVVGWKELESLQILTEAQTKAGLQAGKDKGVLQTQAQIKAKPKGGIDKGKSVLSVIKYLLLH